MWSKVIGILLLLVGTASAQTVRGDRFTLNTGPCTIRSGSGSPEGAVIGNPCDVWHRTDGGTAWVKLTGTGNTGWSMLLTGAGVALTKIDDTNVTVTLGGSPSTALLQATSLTLGWTGQLGVARGGTGASTLTTNGILYGNGTSAVGITAQGATNTLLAGNAGVPTFTATPTVTSLTTTGTLAVGGDATFAANVTASQAYAQAKITGAAITQVASGTSYTLKTYPDAATGSVIQEAFGGGAYVPYRMRSSTATFDGAATLKSTLDVTGNSAFSGYLRHPSYASQTSKWNISDLGEADFRYLFVDEMHAKVFIADLEQALAGSQIIAKSVGQLQANFSCPAAPGIGTLYVNDFPGAPGMQVFQSGDYVVTRSFDRSAGSLTIADCVGVVTSADTAPSGYQSWTFTRVSGETTTGGGTAPGGTVMAANGLALDYGVSGNGAVETNAIDGVYGVNSPYTQVKTWSGASPASGNFSVRTRVGNLKGLTGTTEWGAIFGTYSASGGQYLRLSDQNFEVHGLKMSLYNSTTEVMRFDPLAISFAMGTTLPTSFTSGTGCWQGFDAGVFKWRCGDPTGATQYIGWNGTTLTVAGNIVVTGTSIDASTVTGVAGATVVSGAARGLLGIDSFGNPLLPTTAHPSGSGLFLGSDYMGYYTASAWKTYMDSSGNFYLGGTGGALQWNGTTLTIAATLSGNGSAITSISGGNITTGSVTATQIAAGTITAAKIAAGTITANEIAAGTITATQIAANTITAAKIAAGTITAAELAAGSVTAAKISVSSLDAVSANLGTVTINTTGSLASGATALTTGTGFWLSYNGGTPQMRIGNPAGNQMVWDGSTLTVTGVVNASSGSFTGAVYASSGSFTGAVTATSGSFTGTVTATSGSFTGNVDATYLTASAGTFGGGSTGVDIDSTGLVVNGSSGHITAGAATLNGNGVVVQTGSGVGSFNGYRFSDDSGLFTTTGGQTILYSTTSLLLSGGDVTVANRLNISTVNSTTDSAQVPLVLLSGQVMVSGVGAHGNNFCSGSSVQALSVTHGIVSGITCASPAAPTLASLQNEISELRALIAQLYKEKR